MSDTHNKIERKATDMLSSMNRGAYSSLTDADDRYSKTDLQSRLIGAGLIGLGTGASIAGIGKLIAKYAPKHKGKFGMPAAITSGLVGGTAGYFFPDMRNMAIKTKSGKASSEEYEDMSRRISEKQLGILKKYMGIQAPIEKEAGLVLNTLGGFGRGAWKLGKEIKSGVFHIPRKKDSVGTMMWSAGTKLGVGGAAILGTEAVVKNIEAPRSDGTYSTMLRNNVLAGQIKPNELSKEEFKNVSELGMR